MGPGTFSKWLMVSVLALARLTAAGSDAPLADAAEQMDSARIRTLLQQRVDVNAPQIDGTTALHWAAYQDDLQILKLLLRGGADVPAAEPLRGDGPISGLHKRKRSHGRAASGGRGPTPTPPFGEGKRS